MAINPSSLGADEIKQMQLALTPRMNKYIPSTPTPKQTAALLMNNVKELLYGGSAGGGKSHFLLMAALQYVDEPNYAAILFRKTFSDLMLPGALIPMSREWLTPYLNSGEVHWQDKEKKYTFLESGATLSFGYLDNAGDELRYQGAQFQFIGMDECTHIIPASYRYLFSRLRRLKKSKVPIRFRATCNPGSTYGEYYYDRFFVDNKDAEGRLKRFFLQSGLKDNPHIDAETYRESLAELDEVTRAQLEDGNWDIRPKGDLFDAQWLRSVSPLDVPKHTRWVRFWDLASIDPRYRKKTGMRAPDFSVGLKLGMADGYYYIGDIVKFQKTPGDTETIIRATAEADGYSCAIRMEEEGGSSGVTNTLRYARHILSGFDYAGVKSVVSKIERARPVASAMQVGTLHALTTCRCLTDLYTQLTAFPNGANDDIVDCLSGAFSHFKPSLGSMVPPPPLTSTRRIELPGEREARIISNAAGGSYWHNSMSRRQ